MRTLLVSGLLLLCLLLFPALVVPVAAAPDSCQVWRKTQKTYDRQEAEFWEAFRSSVDDVFTAWREDWLYWRNQGDVYSLEALDFGPLREIYAEHADIQAARVEADLELARAGHDRGAEMLLDVLFRAAKALEKLEKEHDEARPVRSGAYYDQEPAIRIRGLYQRIDGLGQALAEAPGGVALMVGSGWEKAAKADKKRSLLRRVALLDGLGYTSGAAEARAHLEGRLEASEPGLRIVAAENLVALGAEAIGWLRPLLSDPAPAVRRALLHAIRERASDTPAWVPHLLDTMQNTRGLLRARVLETLQTLTGQPIGDDPDAWRTWLDANRTAVEAGTWKRPEAEGEEEEKPPAALPTVSPAASFYGVGVPSRYITFVVDGTERMGLPVDLQAERSKSRRFWLRTTAWHEDYVDHHTTLREQLTGTVEGLPDSARLALVYLNGSTPSRVPVFGEKKPLKPSKGTLKTLQKALGKGRPGGTLSVEEGLRLSFALSRIDPFENPAEDAVELDTVCALDTGWNGGRWGLPEVLIEGFARKNRFYRLQVNAIRYSDLGEESEGLLKGLAEISGGTYRHLRIAP